MFVIAEAGQCHEGNMAVAEQMIVDAQWAGASAIKFQTLTPHKIAAPDAAKYWDDDFGTDNQADAFKIAGNFTTEAEWAELADRCRSADIEMMTTPFDLDAVNLLDPHVNRWKIASGDITNRRLIEAVARTAKPIVLSTGAATLTEIRRACDWIEAATPWAALADNTVTLLACSLQYPTPDEYAELSRIGELAEAFSGYPIGYSDHTLKIETGLAAAAVGATVLERHYTYAGDDKGPVADHAMAVNPTELAQYVNLAKLGETLRGFRGLGTHAGEEAARHGARRSLYTTRLIEAGETIGPGDVIELRPGPLDGDIGAEDVNLVLGQNSTVRLARGTRLQWEQVSSG